jgi:hypothetical protein
VVRKETCFVLDQPANTSGQSGRKWNEFRFRALPKTGAQPQDNDKTQGHTGRIRKEDSGATHVRPNSIGSMDANLERFTLVAIIGIEATEK